MPTSERWARFVTKRPIPVLAIGLAGLIALALPAMHMRLGLPDAENQPTSSTERRAYDPLTEGFGPGFNGTLTVVVDAPGHQGAAEAGRREDHGRLTALPNVAAVSEPVQNDNGEVTIASVTPKSGPSSDETKGLVNLIRDKAREVEAETDVSVYVTGQTAVNIDTADRLAEKPPSYVVVVIGLALILLMLVFRSILVRIKAAVGFPAQHRRLDGTRGRDLPGRPHGKARESIVTGYRQSGRVVSAAAGLAFAPRSPAATSGGAP
jgi:putative drug exporter of the RND superfamily